MATNTLPTDEYEYKNGLWYWHGHECKGADNASFNPHNNVWAMDRKGLFKQAGRARVRDFATCQVLNLLFAKDAYQVYYIEGTAKVVEDVDSFETLDAGRYVRVNERERRFGFARDCKNIYCHDFFSGAPKVLKGAIRNEFIRLDYGFAKDLRRVWRESYRIKKADPDSFSPITDLYSKDSQRVFYGETPLEDADPATFRIIAGTYSADQKHVYFQRSLLSVADPNTFEIIGESTYCRDKNAVYYRCDCVEGADLDSFEVIEGSWSEAKDKYRKYKRGKPMA